MVVLDTSKDLSALFSRQVQATPDAIAIEDGTTTWTYAELDRQAEHLAGHLRKKHGVGRDVLVGILMGHSTQYIAACLAALKAGGAFLVLEVAYPPALLAEVIEDAKPAVIITSPAHVDRIVANVPSISLSEGASAGPTLLDGGDDAALPPKDSSNDSNDDSDLDRLAFVSYSSGSTGRPKGIGNPHRAAVTSYDLRFRFSNQKPGDRVAANVFFVWEMLRPLLRGATVVAVPDDVSYDPVNLTAFLAAHRITETLMTPTLLATVLTRYPDLSARLPLLQTLWLNGEVVAVDLARRALDALDAQRRGARLLNCYSASETHEIACCDLTAIFPTDAAICPAGSPMDPAHTYVLDEDSRPVPVGTTGELYVGGDLLARGYLNRPETTAAAFLPDAFDQTTPGARMYRTGDRACMLPSGELVISGRVGGIIKLRGYTVQPATVEGAIVKHLAVRSCVVVGVGDGLQRQLVAYVVRDQAAGDRASLDIHDGGHSPLARRLLADHLAHYMIPRLWVPLDSLPTHKVSGKIDLKGLPLPQAASPNMTPPETPLAPLLEPPRSEGIAGLRSGDAITLADIRRHWAACLGMDEAFVTAQYDFFDLGGHSLALADLASKLSHAHDVTVPLLDLIRTPTLDGHLQAVLAARQGHIARVETEQLRALLRQDCVLPDDIKPAVTDTAIKKISQATDVFLTGATGFLGAFLLEALLAETTATIHCLVRLPSSSKNAHAARSAGMARLRKHLVEQGLWQGDMVDRIRIVPGDLALPKLGLPAAQFDVLASHVQAVVHAGASVNLVYPYDALRDANVGGTKEILRLAARGGATLHYVSTNGVLPTAPTAYGEDATLAADDVVDKLADGYDQTKWVAEELVRAAVQRGLPVRVYRPGTLGGHSQSGSSNARDVITALIVESLRLGKAPNVDGWRIEMTPVDYASRAIVALADSDEADVPRHHTVFHVGDPLALSAHDLFDRLAHLGYATTPVRWDEWVALWTAVQHGDDSGPPDHDDPSPADILRSGMPYVDALKEVTVLDDARTAPLLEKHGLVRPPMDLALLRTYTRHFYSRGWLDAPPKAISAAAAGSLKTGARHTGPLAGKVAVVTGASSGIGAATAMALAREGAHVAIAARRADALKTLKGAIEQQHGVKVLAQPTDVTDGAQVAALVQAATAQLGPVDIVVVCAGVMYFTMMANTRTDEWERTVDVNCKGLLHCLSATLPGMLARGTGHIVAITSDAGRHVFPGLGVYSGSKFFMEAVLNSLRLETAGSGLRVTAVQPGNVATELLSISTDPEAMQQYGTPTGAKVLDAEDVASAVVYALRQPEHVAVNEVLIEPREEPT